MVVGPTRRSSLAIRSMFRCAASMSSTSAGVTSSSRPRPTACPDAERQARGQRICLAAADRLAAEVTLDPASA
jgi:hypothetical protein